MNDRYQELRKALEMGPTPGPFSILRSYSSGNQELVLSLTYKDEHGITENYCTVRSRLGDTRKTEVNAAYIAACDPDTIRALLEERDALRAEVEQLRSADDEVVFIDGVGAARSSVKSCRGGVQWIRVGDRVYWPLSDADAQRLQSACCGNGHFDGPTMPAAEVLVLMRAHDVAKALLAKGNKA